jgi:dolichol-phosphate mannosyltransferase
VPVLHLVIPFLDEDATLGTIVERVQACDWPNGWSVRIVLVDDGSGPEAAASARELAARTGAVLLRHEVNQGKGAALRTGFSDAISAASPDDLAGVQDADLEYAPGDLVPIVAAFQQRGAAIDAAFGNRWTGERRSAIRRVHRFGNRMLTRLSNAFTGLRVSDMECCYKVMRLPMLERILPDLDEDRFAIEPQLAAALARHGARVVEFPVSYDPRSFSEGKKIGLGDAISAFAAMLREWRRTRRHRRTARRGSSS